MQRAAPPEGSGNVAAVGSVLTPMPTPATGSEAEAAPGADAFEDIVQDKTLSLVLQAPAPVLF